MCTCIKWLPSPHICLLILQLHPFIDSHTRKLISISYNIGVISCVHLAHIHKSYCFMPTQRRPSYEPAWHSSLGSYSVEKLLEVEKAGIGQVFWQPFWCPCPTGSQPLEIRLPVGQGVSWTHLRFLRAEHSTGKACISRCHGRCIDLHLPWLCPPGISNSSP